MVVRSERAKMKASPRSPAVSAPSLDTCTELSLFDTMAARWVMSRSVPSEYFARTVRRWVAPAPSSTTCLG